MLKFIFLHKNFINVSICKKEADGYLLDGWYKYKELDKVEYDSSNYYSINCVSTCAFPLYEEKKITLYSSDEKHGNLKNYIDKNGDIVKVSSIEDKEKDLRESLKKTDYFLLKSRFNDGKIYIGTNEEILNYFEKKKEKYISKIDKETNIDVIKRIYKVLEGTEKKIMAIKNEQISTLISENETLTKSLNGVKEQITKSVLWDNQFKPKYDRPKAEDF